MQDPIVIRSLGDEQYAGCTGVPADTHTVWWLTVGCLVSPPYTAFLQRVADASMSNADVA